MIMTSKTFISHDPSLRQVTLSAFCTIDQLKLNRCQSFLGDSHKQSFLGSKSKRQMKLLKKLTILTLSSGLSLLSSAWIAGNAQGNHHARGELVTQRLISEILKENRIGIDPARNLKVYLPASYHSSTRRYPVVYLLHNIFWNNDRMFEDGRILALIDSAFGSGLIGEFILVAPDYRTATTGSIYDNSPVSGRWLDFTTDEVVPLIDREFRTIAKSESRAVIGEMMGGRGALKLGMTRPDVFSLVYAMHPVATGMGEVPWSYSQIDWKKIYDQKTTSAASLDGIAQIFVVVCQTYLPNPDRPPYYCDFFMQPEGNTFKPDPINMAKARCGFIIGESLDEYTGNLKKLRGLAFDWGRFDAVYAHVDSNRELSRKLQDLGIAHQAEEYAGGPNENTWTQDGRFYQRVLPFLTSKLDFGKK